MSNELIRKLQEYLTLRLDKLFSKWFVDCKQTPFDSRLAVNTVMYAAGLLLKKMPVKENLVILIGGRSDFPVYAFFLQAVLQAHLTQQKSHPDRTFGLGLQISDPASGAAWGNNTGALEILDVFCTENGIPLDVNHGKNNENDAERNLRIVNTALSDMRRTGNRILIQQADSSGVAGDKLSHPHEGSLSYLFRMRGCQVLPVFFNPHSLFLPADARQTITKSVWVYTSHP